MEEYVFAYICGGKLIVPTIMEKYRVGVVHPQPMIRLAIQSLIERHVSTFHLIGTYSSCKDFIKALAHGKKYDIIIGALENFKLSLECIHQLRALQSYCHVIVMSDKLTIKQKQKLYIEGVDVCLSIFCTPDELCQSLNSIVYGSVRPKLLDNLSTRELDIVRFSAQGLNATEIAHRLFISNRTVQNHKLHIYKKTGVHTMDELLDLCRQEFASKNYNDEWLLADAQH